MTLLQPKYPIIQSESDEPGQTTQRINDGINNMAEEANKTFPIVTKGTAAPTTTPYKVGDFAVDTSAPALYYAKGNASSSDWIRSSAPGIRVIGSNTSSAVFLSGNDNLIASRWAATATTYIKTLTVTPHAFTAGNKIMMAIYEGNNTPYPTTKIGTTEEHTLIASDLGREVHFDLTASVKITKGADYWLVWNVDSNNFTTFYAHGTTSGFYGYYHAQVYDGTMPDTFPAGGTVYRPHCVSALT